MRLYRTKISIWRYKIYNIIIGIIKKCPIFVLFNNTAPSAPRVLSIILLFSYPRRQFFSCTGRCKNNKSSVDVFFLKPEKTTSAILTITSYSPTNDIYTIVTHFLACSFVNEVKENECQSNYHSFRMDTLRRVAYNIFSRRFIFSVLDT